MIRDPIRLQEVVDEITDWTLGKRREYLAALEQAYGPAAAQQIRDALTARWQTK